MNKIENESTFKLMLIEVEEQTDLNDHTGAKLTVAKYFKYTHYIKAFELIEKLHTNDGHLYSELGYYRKEKGNEMMQLILKEYGQEIYNKVKKAF